LAVEDIFQLAVNSRSKADYYTNQMFVQTVALLHDGVDEESEDHEEKVLNSNTSKNATKPSRKPSWFVASPTRDAPEAVAEQGNSPYSQASKSVDGRKLMMSPVS